MSTERPRHNLEESLALVQGLLERHRVLEAMTHRQEGPKRDLLESLQHRQNLAELQTRLKALHPADLAYILEALPGPERLLVWEPLGDRKRAEVLVEVGEAVRGSLIQATSRSSLNALLREMDPDDLAYVADSLSEDVRSEVWGGLDDGALSWVRSSVAYPEGSVGELMSREFVCVKDSLTIEAALLELRRRGQLPDHTDKVFVVDVRNVLKGALRLQALLVSAPDQRVDELSSVDAPSFLPEDRADQAAKAFERYDLVSAAVVDERGKLIGRLTVDAVVDFIRRRSEIEALKRAGLSGEEDLFAPVWDSARNRWLWLAVNLVTAFVASRVIGQFESTIAQLVALATLMPIVASIGGNTGNQTVALMIRALALDQLTPASTRHLVAKELRISLLNGLVWGTVVGLFAVALYGSLALGTVMATAVLLNLVVAALVGIAVPLFLHRTGRDPAQGSSVLLTFTTDSMGFFIFLGLARAFLV